MCPSFPPHCTYKELQFLQAFKAHFKDSLFYCDAGVAVRTRLPERFGSKGAFLATSAHPLQLPSLRDTCRTLRKF